MPSERNPHLRPIRRCGEFLHEEGSYTSKCSIDNDVGSLPFVTTTFFASGAALSTANPTGGPLEVLLLQADVPIRVDRGGVTHVFLLLLIGPGPG